MGSVTMHANQILLVGFLFLGISCEKPEDGKKPAVVDWEQNNFGIRTSHSNEDVLNKVNIDANAPQIPKRVKPKHKQRKNEKSKIKARNNLRIRMRNKMESVKEPGELESTTTHTTKQDIRSSGRSSSANSVARRKTSRTSGETKQTKQNSGTRNIAAGIRSARLRSRVHPRLRTTTEAVIEAETLEETLPSALKLKPNFADFKQKFIENLSMPPKEKKPHKATLKATTSDSLVTSTTTTATTKTSRMNFWHRTTSRAVTISERTDMLETTVGTEKSQKESEETEIKAVNTSTEENTSDTIIDDAVEIVTQTTTSKSQESKKVFDRKIPEIGDPAVEEKLNRLTISERGNIRRRNRKPDNTSSRRITIARPRGTIRTGGSLEPNNGELIKNEGAEAAKLSSHSSIRSRIRRPQGFRHHFRSNKKPKSKDPVVPKSIKRMRIKSNDQKVATSDKKTDEVPVTPKPKSRFRLPTGGRAPSSQTSDTNSKKGSPVRRLHNPTGRRGRLTTKTTTTTTKATTSETSTTTTTTEKITISPNAHKISYTLNDSDYMDIITSETPLMEVEHNRLDQPVAQELISVVPIPDNMFSQATHQLMKARKTSSETFLPTLVPLVKKTPSSNEGHQVPIFEAGTKQPKQGLGDEREVILPAPVKRGRYILAATSNG